jgi:carbonic anhydrase/acetyltransferase-like protein (isoleucine patch superfamily)
MLRAFKGKMPKLGARVFVDESAQVIGDVEIGDDSSIWMGSVLRGDVHYIRIGRRCSVQDLSVLHTELGECPVELGDDVTIGHGVILHGCKIGAGCLIGMGAKLLSGSQVGEGSIIAAGALVTEGMIVPPRTLMMGMPAKPKRTLSDEEAARLIAHAAHYVAFKDDFLKEQS